MSTLDFQKFSDYDFNADSLFLSGLSTLQQSVPVLTPELEFQAKTFFFQRKFGISIDREAYENWKSKSSAASLETSNLAESTVGDESNNTSDEKYPSKYAEIVELIMSGKPIPGIIEVPDTVLGKDAASVSSSERRKKPWES